MGCPGGSSSWVVVVGRRRWVVVAGRRRGSSWVVVGRRWPSPSPSPSWWWWWWLLLLWRIVLIACIQKRVFSHLAFFDTSFTGMGTGTFQIHSNTAKYSHEVATTDNRCELIASVGLSSLYLVVVLWGRSVRMDRLACQIATCWLYRKTAPPLAKWTIALRQQIVELESNCNLRSLLQEKLIDVFYLAVLFFFWFPKCRLTIFHWHRLLMIEPFQQKEPWLFPNPKGHVSRTEIPSCSEDWSPMANRWCGPVSPINPIIVTVEVEIGSCPSLSSLSLHSWNNWLLVSWRWGWWRWWRWGWWWSWWGWWWGWWW